MIKYVCQANKDKFRFELVDMDGNAIASSLFYEQCKAYLSKLNNGSGFDGRVPKFFCEPLLNLD